MVDEVDNNPPPVTKYKYTVVITANSHEEIQKEIDRLLKGVYLLDSRYETRDSFDCYGGTTHRTLELTNPDMTDEKYERELNEWSYERSYRRRQDHSKNA